jgi:hypothetical protein
MVTGAWLWYFELQCIKSRVLILHEVHTDDLERTCKD